MRGSAGAGPDLQHRSHQGDLGGHPGAVHGSAAVRRRDRGLGRAQEPPLTVPIAAMLALPALWYGGLAIIIAVFPLVGAKSWAISSAGSNKAGLRWWPGRPARTRSDDDPVGRCPRSTEAFPESRRAIPARYSYDWGNCPNHLSRRSKRCQIALHCLPVRLPGRRFTSRVTRPSFTSCGFCATRRPSPRSSRGRSRAVVAARLRALADVEVKPITVTTPLETTDAAELGVRIGLVPILRAGLGMVDAMLELMPRPRSGTWASSATRRRCGRSSTTTSCRIQRR